MIEQPHILKENLDRNRIPKPIVGLCLAFMCGIVYGAYFPVVMPWLFLLLLILISAWWMLNRNPHSILSPQFNRTMTLALVMMLGALRMQIHLDSWQQLCDEVSRLSRLPAQNITGMVEEIRENENRKATAYITKVQFEKWNRRYPFGGNLEIRGFAKQIASLRPGDILQVTGKVVPIRGPSVPTGGNYQAYLYSQAIFGSVSMAADEDIRQIPVQTSGYSHRIRGLAYSLLEQVKIQLPNHTIFGNRLTKPNQEGVIGLMASICLGLNSTLPPDLNQALSVSGLAHLTSISGLHITGVLFLFSHLLKLGGMRRRSAVFVTAVFAVIYVILVGAKVPVLRSVIMAFAVLGNQLTQRRVNPLNSLALAALGLLLFFPTELFQASFQMSFVSVLLLFLFKPLQERIAAKIRNRVGKWLFLALASSTVVTIGLTPFTIYYFHYWTWGAIAANLAAIPLCSLFMLFAYAWMGAILLPLSFLTQFLGYGALNSAYLLIQISHFFADRLYFWEEMAFPGITPLVLWFLAFLFLSRPRLKWNLHGKRDFCSYHFSMLFILLTVFSQPLISRFNPLTVSFLSVGEGDCSLIQTPAGKTLLIDGGPLTNISPGSRHCRLVEFLFAEGKRRLDSVILTHPDVDHFGALEEVVNTFSVGVFMEGETNSPSEKYISLIQTVERRSIPRTKIRAGDQINLGENIVLRFLHPDEKTIKSRQDDNEKSIVALLESGKFKILFTGDISQETENNIFKNYIPQNVEILKVSHHGSARATGMEFLQKVRPAFAVIEVGPNAYGHPALETIQRLYAVQAQVLRTDYEGTVRMIQRGNGYRIYTSRSNRLYLPQSEP